MNDQQETHIVICADDDAYLASAFEWVNAFKKNGAKKIYLAGKPQGLAEDKLQQAGLTDFLYLGQNVYSVLNAFVSED
jgi:methylmalonyl-CoA mutase cobalamin-binding subunit